MIRNALVAFAAIAALESLAHAQDWPAAPSSADIAADPTVSDAMDDAWDDSQADDKDKRHEEGGWILQCRRRETPETEWDHYYEVVRVPAGQRAGIAPGAPPARENCRIVAFFHTHPNPPTDEDGNQWDQGPSDADTNWHDAHGFPGIIRNGAGAQTFGPASGVYTP